MKDLTFTKMMQENINKLAECVNGFRDIHKLYFDNGFGTGGANEIQTEEIEPVTGMTKEDVVSGVTLAENVIKLADGTSPANAVYQTTINKIRTE